VKVEWLIIGDYAEIVGGKLYLMGGGWDVLTVNTGFPLTRPLGLAAAFSVPWNETNERRSIEIDIQTEDGQTVGKMSGKFEVGRPAGIKQGQDQRFQLAATLPLNLPAPATYVIAARIDGQEGGRVSFNVVAGAMLQPKRE
jgi:hypothetical protein